MRRGHAVLLVTIAITVGGARAAWAQKLEAPTSRQGYYVALGMHAALSHNRDEGDGLGVWKGYENTLRFGQLVNRRLGLGVQLDLGRTFGRGQSATMFGLGLAGQVALARSLALHGVVGLGVVSLSDPEKPDTLRGAYGAAYTVSLTYDWFPWQRRSGGWAVTPGISLRALPADPIDAYAGFLGVEISYWTGLPKNQLDLPPDQAFRGD